MYRHIFRVNVCVYCDGDVLVYTNIPGHPVGQAALEQAASRPGDLCRGIRRARAVEAVAAVSAERVEEPDISRRPKGGVVLYKFSGNKEDDMIVNLHRRDGSYE